VSTAPNDVPRAEGSGRRHRRLAIVLSVLAVLGLAVGYGYFHVFRLSTRGPGIVASGMAADFSLPDDAGKAVPLSALTARGPAVLVFYRGYW
jgi:hypothetical protein